MADEREERFEGQDDGEYHFSDEQMNYEMDDVSQHGESKAAGSKEAAGGALGKNRRYLIGGGAFIFLIFIIYRMLTPTAVAPTGEIAQVVAPKPVPMVQPQNNNPVATQARLAAPQSAPVAVPQQLIQQPAQTQTPMVTASMPVSADVKAIVDKLDALSEQNGKLAYAVGTEYPQRFASYEEQNAALQSKVQDLNSRIASLEASMNQLTQALQGGGARPQPQQQPTTTMQITPGVKPADPKITYTVQAIIPGRAWLKSDAGDAVTIAEGDVLKDFGRVTKIDPYDGVVEVDTGSKVVSLTYGGGSE